MGSPHQREGVVEAAPRLRWDREPGAPGCRGRGQGFPGHNYARIRLASPGLVGRGQPLLPEKSHVISLGQFLMCLENVGIATTRFQSLKDVLGNYVRHLWGTMRVTVGVPRIRRVLQGFVGRSQGSRPYFRGLAVDSRMVRTGLRFWCCSGCGEDLVDEVDALWCGATRVHPRQ